MTAPQNAVVGLYMDTPYLIEPGHVIRTQTGRCYRVLTARRQTKGKHIGRWHLNVQVMHPDWVTAEDTVIPLHWYRR